MVDDMLQELTEGENIDLAAWSRDRYREVDIRQSSGKRTHVLLHCLPAADHQADVRKVLRFQ